MRADLKRPRFYQKTNDDDDAQLLCIDDESVAHFYARARPPQLVSSSLQISAGFSRSPGGIRFATELDP